VTRGIFQFGLEARSQHGGAENARLEIARLETRERIGYGKTIKPKQPAHLNSRR